MDLTHVDRFFDRNKRAIVGLIFEDEIAGSLYVATGVAVRLGGRIFILTAAHNVWSGGRLNKLAMGMPTEQIATLIYPGNGSAGRVHVPRAGSGSDPEPDVAVIEPTAKTVLPPEPFGEDDIGFFDTTQVSEISDEQVAGCELVVTGFPSRMAVLTPASELKRPGATLGALNVGMMSMRGWSIPSLAGDRLKFTKEPADGRGVHVYMSIKIEDQEGNTAEAVSPVGMSGGPLVVPKGNGVLVGLMRGKMDFHEGWDMWCEPAAEAVRLLVDHEDGEVATSARRVVARYEEALAAARATLLHAIPQVAGAK
jgi:hypothetical protein